MDNINRSTHACSLEDLQPVLKAALRAHLAAYKLTDLEPEILMCCETNTTRQKKGLFGGGVETTQSAAFVTPNWLVWADSTDRNDAGAGSADLRRIDVRDYQETAMYEIAPDEGLDITGRYTDSNKTGMTFIALGAEPDGQKFRQVLQEAMKTAKSK